MLTSDNQPTYRVVSSSAAAAGDYYSGFYIVFNSNVTINTTEPVCWAVVSIMGDTHSTVPHRGTLIATDDVGVEHRIQIGHVLDIDGIGGGILQVAFPINPSKAFKMRYAGQNTALAVAIDLYARDWHTPPPGVVTVKSDQPVVTAGAKDAWGNWAAIVGSGPTWMDWANVSVYDDSTAGVYALPSYGLRVQLGYGPDAGNVTPITGALMAHAQSHTNSAATQYTSTDGDGLTGPVAVPPGTTVWARLYNPNVSGSSPVSQTWIVSAALWGVAGRAD